MTTQAGYICLRQNQCQRYSLEKSSFGVMEQPDSQVVHYFPVSDLASAFYFLAGRFSQCEGAEWETMSNADVALFKRIRGGSLDSIIADVVLPDRPRPESRNADQMLRDLKERTWQIQIVGNGGFVLVDDNGVQMAPEEWQYLRNAMDHGQQKRGNHVITMNNWVRCGEIVKPE